MSVVVVALIFIGEVSHFPFVCVYAGMRQHDDRGSQYRSSIYTSNPAQQELAMKSKVAFQQVQYTTHHKEDISGRTIRLNKAGLQRGVVTFIYITE